MLAYWNSRYRPIACHVLSFRKFRLVVDYLEGSLSVATWYDSPWIGGTASGTSYRSVEPTVLQFQNTYVSKMVINSSRWLLNKATDFKKHTSLNLLVQDHSNSADLAKANPLRTRSPGDFRHLIGTFYLKDDIFTTIQLAFSRHIRQILGKCHFSKCQRSFKKFLDPDPETDDLQYVITSSVSTDTFPVKFSGRFWQ